MKRVIDVTVIFSSGMLEFQSKGYVPSSLLNVLTYLALFST